METTVAVPLSAPATIALPAPRLEHRATLMRALELRRSSRAFSPRRPDIATLAELLWAACGINRPHAALRTAPSAHNWQEIDVYVVMPEGAYLYEPRDDVLRLVAPGDHRGDTGLQDYPALAPVNLVYVADLTRMTEASAADRAFYSAIDVGFIAENVYLYCAAVGLACVVRGLVDRALLANVLGLRDDQRVIAAQSVGYPQRAG